MLFVAVGVLLLALHFLGIGPPARWTFEVSGDLWKFVLPFLLALAWWAWADMSGLTRRREMNREAERKADRRRRNMVSAGSAEKKSRDSQFGRR